MGNYDDLEYMQTQIERFVEEYDGAAIGHQIKNRYENSNKEDIGRVADIYRDIECFGF